MEIKDTMVDKTLACDECGLLFDTSHHEQRHLKQGWCPMNSKPLTKRMKSEDSIEPDIDHEENIMIVKRIMKFFCCFGNKSNLNAKQI